MKPELIAVIGLVVILILGVLVMKSTTGHQFEGFDFIKPYTPSDQYVPSVTNNDTGSPAAINKNYDRIIHPSEVCSYREPRDRVGLTNPYGIGFSTNLAINRDTYLNIYDMYQNRLAKQCHPSIQGPLCDYLERTNPLFRGVSTFNEKPFEPNRLGNKAAKTVDELKSGADPLNLVGLDGYYRDSVDRPSNASVSDRPDAKENFSVPSGEYTSRSGSVNYDAAETDVTGPTKTVSSYDFATPSDTNEYKHYPHIIHPAETCAYNDQRATYFKNPYKLGFSKSSIINRDTYHDQFDEYERRQPSLCHPSNLYPVLDHLRRTGGTTDRRTGSFDPRVKNIKALNLTERFDGNLYGTNPASQANNDGTPSYDTWDLKDPRICTEQRIGCPRTIPKLPMKVYSKCYEHNRSRLVNPVIDVDPYQYW